MKVNSYKGNITELKSDEVFVFGSNYDSKTGKGGFHGAGSAGYATFNEVGNLWRKYEYDQWADGAKGKWNVKGIGEGPQVGEIGKSYALPTVVKAGAKRSRTPQEISLSIKKLYEFAKKRPHLKFYIAQDAKMGLNGYTEYEMMDMFNSYPIPENVYFKEEFAALFKNL